METDLEKSAALGNVKIEEKMSKSSSSGAESHDFVQINKGENQRHNKQEDDSSKPSPDKKDISTMITEDNQIESVRATMGEVKEENERLKLLISQVLKDCQSLQMRFLDILQQEEAKNHSTMTAPSDQENEESDDLVSLSLGRSSGSHETKKEEKKSSNLISKGEEDEKNEGLELSLEWKFEPAAAGSTDEPEKEPSSGSSLGKQEDEEASEAGPPTKILKTVRSGDDKDLSEQMQVKKARVSVRARCDAPTMNDGCQWRKYGQKTAKGNPCPRAYYRCTVSPNCPVRKQVQRCVEDMSILITTYEGIHNHPLPLSATAMASTTSAAASMLQSQSSSSQPGLGTSVFAAPSASASSAANLHGLNFNFSQNSRPYQYYFPNSSISNLNAHPTITLDLTSPANSSHFSRFSNVPRDNSLTCFSFSSSPSSSVEGFNPQASWSTSQLTFGAFPNHKNSFIGAPLNPGRQQSDMQMSNRVPPQQQALSETITAATKAITSNPSFCSALAAALTSIVGNGGGAPRDVSGNERKWGEPLETAHPAAAENEVGRALSYLEISSSMTQQQQKQGSLLLFPTSNSTASDPPADNSNHIKR